MSEIKMSPEALKLMQQADEATKRLGMLRNQLGVFDGIPQAAQGLMYITTAHVFMKHATPEQKALYQEVLTAVDQHEAQEAQA